MKVSLPIISQLIRSFVPGEGNHGSCITGFVFYEAQYAKTLQGQAHQYHLFVSPESKFSTAVVLMTCAEADAASAAKTMATANFMAE